MVTALIILTLLACVFLMLVILAQNPKGGGLSSNFTGTSQVMGARRAADTVEKATWLTAIGIIALVLLTNFVIPKPSQSGSQQQEQEGGSLMEEQIQQIPQSMQGLPQQQGGSDTIGGGAPSGGGNQAPVQESSPSDAEGTDKGVEDLPPLE